jgi:hypothetical protein
MGEGLGKERVVTMTILAWLVIWLLASVIGGLVIGRIFREMGR